MYKFFARLNKTFCNKNLKMFNVTLFFANTYINMNCMKKIVLNIVKENINNQMSNLYNSSLNTINMVTK